VVGEVEDVGAHVHERATARPDDRAVEPERVTKSISAETTFDCDIADTAALAAELWPLCETVARRLRDAELAAGGVTLKLKTTDFRLLTRAHRLPTPTQRAELLFREGLRLLDREATGATPFRLIGIGTDALVGAREADPPDLFEDGPTRGVRLDEAVGELRAKLGAGAIIKGSVWPPKR
jgi:DNA polymerase-4